jgi:hypothetical protein
VAAVPGLPLLLPAYASLEGSSQPLIRPTSSPNAYTYSWVAGGGYLYVPLSVSFSAITSNFVTNRNAELYLTDASGNIIWEVLGQNNLGASLNVVCTFSALVPVALGVANSPAFLPFPPSLLLAGWTLYMLLANGVPGDSISQPVIVMMQFPTMTTPRLGAPPPPAAFETPVLA